MRRFAQDQETGRPGGAPDRHRADGMTRTAGSLVLVPPGSSVARVPHFEQRVFTECALPARLEAWLRVIESFNPVAPTISLQAALVLPGLQARVIFRDRAHGEDCPVEEVAVHVPLVPPGEQVPLPPHPIHGVPRGSTLTLCLVDGEGEPITGVREVGECLDGICDAEIPLDVNVNAVAWVAARDWSERRGPRIRLSGELSFSRGVTLRIGFRPPRRQEGGIGEGATEVPVVRPGMTLCYPDKSAAPGVPGHLWVAVRFVDMDGRAVGDEHPVGRCLVA